MHFAVKQVVKAVGAQMVCSSCLRAAEGEKKERTQTRPELKVTHSCSGNQRSVCTLMQSASIKSYRMEMQIVTLEI